MADKASILTEDFDFDNIQQQEKEVKYKGQVYTLREPTSDTVTKWKNAQLDGMTFENGKPTSARGIASIQPLLISMCLFDSAGKLVPSVETAKWPPKITNKLYAWLLAVAELENPATPGELKNE